MNDLSHDPICALATVNGMGAIAVIRVSGKKFQTISFQGFFERFKQFSKSFCAFGLDAFR